MQTILSAILYARELAAVFALLVVLIVLTIRSRRTNLSSAAFWLIGFILCCGLTLVSLFAIITGIALVSARVEFADLLFIPAFPSLLVSGVCLLVLWRSRPKEALAPARIASILALLVTVTICTGALLNETCTRTVTFEVVDAAERPVKGATIAIQRSMVFFGGDDKLVTDSSGQAVLKTWELGELEAKVNSSSGAVTIAIKKSDHANRQLDVKQTWYTSFIEKYPLHPNEAVTFIPARYPLHITSCVMPENEFVPNHILETGHKSLLSDPERIFKEQRNLPFSLLLIKDGAELEKVQLPECPQFYAQSCTLSEFYTPNIVDTLRSLHEAFGEIRAKIAARELSKLLEKDRRAYYSQLVTDLDNMPNKIALKTIKRVMGVGTPTIDSLQGVLDTLRRNGTEATSEELQLIASAEAIVGLEHLQLAWQESAMRLLPVVDDKLAQWEEKAKAVDERQRLLRERPR